jgi:cytidylate kinase
MRRRPLIIAIDGPSGAGKGTVARTIAATLGYRHLDTGAMYRAVAWQARLDSVDLSDGSAVGAVARAATFEIGARVLVNGHEVTEAIRTPEIDAAAAIVARHPEVRSVLVERQRGFAVDGGLVIEGRDIGTVVFPRADVKLYLDASPEERARRRSNDAAHAAGRDRAAVDVVAQALAERDRSDRTRAASPLTKADDAVYIDTTGVPIDQVVQQALAIVQRRMSAA